VTILVTALETVIVTVLVTIPVTMLVTILVTAPPLCEASRFFHVQANRICLIRAEFSRQRIVTKAARVVSKKVDIGLPGKGTQAPMARGRST
jgi:hypothetical protein